MKLLFAAAIATLQTQSTLATPPLKVFVTSQSYNGVAFGGVSGADTKCQDLAAAAGLPDPGSFLAWLSDSSSSPAIRFNNPSNLSYQLVDGTIAIANDFADLTNGNIQNPINVDENGAPTLGIVPTAVWTGTNSAGNLISPNCGGWFDGDGSGSVGSTDFLSGQWTDNGSQSCMLTARLYCFQQEIPTVS